MNFLSVLYAKAGITVDGVTTLNNTATGQTPATNDNSTKLATTGYVKNQNYYPYPTGTTSQYVRGDGSLATFTQTGGGGSSVSYYLNGGTSQGTIGGNTYYEMSKIAVIGTAADFNLNADGYIAQFVTDAGDPALLSIPGGNWNFEMYFSASSGGGTPSFYIELYKYDGTTLTLISSGSTNPESITSGTATDLYLTSLAVPTTTLTLTDRLAIRVYVTHSGRTITLHTQDGHLCQVITTFTTGLTALNGLTAQVQNFAVGAGGSDFNISSVTDTHTFNLPTASATKRGALSSIDWSAFDAKVDFGDLSATSPLNYNGSGVFSIAQSSTSTNGYLSSTDWTTFNNKIGGSGTANYIAKFTSGSVVGNSIFYSDATTTKTIYSGNDVGIYLDFSNNFYALGDGNVTNNGSTFTIDDTSQIIKTSNNSSDKGLYLDFANSEVYLNNNNDYGFASVNYSLYLGDWNGNNNGTTIGIDDNNQRITFSANRIFLGSLSTTQINALIGNSEGDFVYNNTIHSLYFYNGTTWGSVGTVTGTGTTNYVTKFTSGSAIGNSIIYDNGTSVGIGSTSPSAEAKLQIGNGSGTNSQYLRVFSSSTDIYIGQSGGTIFGLAANNGALLVNDSAFPLGIGTTAAQPLVLGTNNAERMRITSAGNVGIGTTSPTTILHLNGVNTLLTITDTTYGRTSNIGYLDYANLYFANDSASNTYIGRYNNVFLAYGGGNVGIGTTAPIHKLSVVGKIGANIFSDSYLEFPSSGHAILKANNDVFVGYSQNFVVKQAGNVGIGTTSPAYTLDVNGTARISGALLISNNDITQDGTRPIVTLKQSGTSKLLLGISSTADDIIVGDVSGDVDFRTNSQAFNFSVNNGGSIAFKLASTGAATFSSSVTAVGQVKIFDSGYPTTYATSLRTQAGAIGILQLGNNNDNYILAGNTGTGGYLIFKVNCASENIASGFEALRLAANGTATFASSVTATSFGGSSYPYNSILGSGADASTSTVFAGSTSGYASSIDIAGGGATNPNTIIFKTASIERMRIAANGNVLIGTTTDAGLKLLVEGIIATKPAGVNAYYSYLKSNWSADNAFELGISGAGAFNRLITSSGYYNGETLQFWTNDNERGRIASGGNFLIGTTTDAGFKLDVNGNVRIATSLRLDGFDTSGYRAIGFGGNTLGTNPTIYSNGSYLVVNSASGQSLYLNSDSTGNVLFPGGGNVGINTTTPQARLSVTGTSGAFNDIGIFQITSGTGASANLKLTFGVNDSGYTWIQSVLPGTNLRALAINPSGGNVLIGTTTDAGYKLAVNGSINMQSNGGIYLNGGLALFPYSNNTYLRPYNSGGNIEFQNYTGALSILTLAASGDATFYGRVNAVAWTTTGRNYSDEWIQFNNATGLYSPINGAHFYPNTGSYGAWKVIGGRNSWGGLEFEWGANGNISLMVSTDSNTTGFHNNNYGWQFIWQNGTLFVFKGTYGAGTQATVLDSSNYNSYAPTLTGTGASGTWGINVTGSSYSSTVTSNISCNFLGTGSVNVNNGSTAVYRNENGNGGNLPYAPVLHIAASDTMWQIQGDYYDSSTLKWRAGYNGTWYTWRTIIHSGNIGSYLGAYLPLAGGNLTGLVQSTANIEATAFRTDGNFELTSATTGLKSNYYDTRFYASSIGGWILASAAAATQIYLEFKQGFGGTTKGYVYYDSSGFGLLNNTGGWAVRTNIGGSMGGTLYGAWISTGSFTASSLIKSGGTSSQFLKADGSIDTNAYITSAALSGYLPLTGGNISGALSVGGGLSTGLINLSDVTTLQDDAELQAVGSLNNGNYGIVARTLYQQSSNVSVPYSFDEISNVIDPTYAVAPSPYDTYPVFAINSFKPGRAYRIKVQSSVSTTTPIYDPEPSLLDLNCKIYLVASDSVFPILTSNHHWETDTPFPNQEDGKGYLSMEAMIHCVGVIEEEPPFVDVFSGQGQFSYSKTYTGDGTRDNRIVPMYVTTEANPYTGKVAYIPRNDTDNYYFAVELSGSLLHFEIFSVTIEEL